MPQYFVRIQHSLYPITRASRTVAYKPSVLGQRLSASQPIGLATHYLCYMLGNLATHATYVNHLPRIFIHASAYVPLLAAERVRLC